MAKKKSVLSIYEDIKLEKSGIIEKICKCRHQQADCENWIVLNKLAFLEENLYNLADLDVFSEEMDNAYQFLKNTEVQIIYFEAELDILNLQLNNL